MFGFALSAALCAAILLNGRATTVIPNAPMVVRLDGTNAEEGRQILVDAGIPADRLISQPTMLDAARTAVAIAKGN